MKEIANTEEFSEVLNEDSLIVVDFWAPWCGPCRNFAPTFEAVAEEHPDVIFCKLDVDQVGDVAQKYGIMSIPTIMYFKNGEPVDKQVGTSPQTTFSERITKLKNQ